MKRFIFEYVPAWLLLVVLALIVIHAPLTVYAGSHWPAIATGVKAWKEGLILLAGVLIAINMARHKRWSILQRDYFGWVILAYWGLHIASLVWSGASAEAAIAGLLIDLRYTLYAACVYHFLLLYPKYRPSFIRVGVIGAVIVMGFAVVQLALPHDALKYLGYSDSTIAPYLTVDKNPDFVRFNSTLRGPNPLGAYAVIVLACVSAFIIRYRHQLGRTRNKVGVGVLGAAGLVALWTSYSRSAVIAAIVALALVLVVRYGRRASRGVWYKLAAGTLVLVALAIAVHDTTFVKNVVFHNNPTTGAAVDSNADHVTSLVDGVRLAASQPMGAGVGTTGSASLFGEGPLIIENQYLMIAHEAGWLGLGLFLAIYIVFLKRVWRERQDWFALGIWASGIGLGIIGLLLPVWADDTIAIVWWGLAAVVLAQGEIHGKSTNQKTA